MTLGTQVTTNKIIEASASKNDVMGFRAAKREALIKAAMTTINNPFFQEEMLADIEKQEKYFR